jgi:nucleotide-binding universal stress UspA family protein
MIRFPPKRIMVGFDRSPLAWTAWRHARALAEAFGAELELVYVEPWRSESGGPGGVPFVLPGLPTAAARKIRRELRAEIGEGPRITVAEGHPAWRLARLAHEHRADLLVVGTHGRSGLSRFFSGSVAEEVLRASPVPVLVARGPVKEIRSVLAPVHFTSYSDRGFAYAAGVATALGARLTALHVEVDPIWEGNSMMHLRRLIESLPPDARPLCESRVVLDGDAAHGIADAASGHDLTVLVAHRKAALADVFLGMTAERVLRGSKTPLLVVPPPHRVAGLQRSAQPASQRPSPRR